jgi:hypothetical protein
MNKDNRVDPEKFQKIIESLPTGELENMNEKQYKPAIDEYDIFKAACSEEKCYLCGKPFKTISKDNPCVHWLLRRGKFKPKDFSKIYEKFDYHQICSFLRWVANQDRFQGNINDLKDERSEKKVFQTTIKWKNIEWTFDCSKSDFEGHGGKHSDFPHYHFQMRIDGNQFINFSQHHVPFSKKDLFKLDLLNYKPELVKHYYGAGGSGMQEAMEIDPEEILENTTVCESEDNATYRMQTILEAGDKPISGDNVQAMFDESRRKGKPLSSLVEKLLGSELEQRTIISPADSVPEINKRKERKR